MKSEVNLRDTAKEINFITKKNLQRVVTPARDQIANSVCETQTKTQHTEIASVEFPKSIDAIFS